MNFKSYFLIIFYSSYLYIVELNSNKFYISKDKTPSFLSQNTVVCSEKELVHIDNDWRKLHTPIRIKKFITNSSKFI
jgi:hypothetical protein